MIAPDGRPPVSHPPCRRHALMAPPRDVTAPQGLATARAACLTCLALHWGRRRLGSAPCRTALLVHLRHPHRQFSTARSAPGLPAGCASCCRRQKCPPACLSRCGPSQITAPQPPAPAALPPALLLAATTWAHMQHPHTAPSSRLAPGCPAAAAATVPA